MAIGLFILAVIIQLVLAIFLLSLSRVSGSIVAIITVIVTAFISPWSLILGIPIALLCLVLLIAPMRQALITKPVYKALGGAMPSMSDTEREALDAGTSWWEKELFMGAPNWDTFANYPYLSCLNANKASSIMKSRRYVQCSMNGKLLKITKT